MNLKLGPKGSQMSQWLYIFTKGYVSNLRSRYVTFNMFSLGMRLCKYEFFWFISKIFVLAVL